MNVYAREVEHRVKLLRCEREWWSNSQEMKRELNLYEYRGLPILPHLPEQRIHFLTENVESTLLMNYILYIRISHMLIKYIGGIYRYVKICIFFVQ